MCVCVCVCVCVFIQKSETAKLSAMFFCRSARPSSLPPQQDTCAEHARGMGEHAKARSMACMPPRLNDLKQGLFFLPLSNSNFCITRKTAAKLIILLIQNSISVKKITF